MDESNVISKENSADENDAENVIDYNLIATAKNSIVFENAEIVTPILNYRHLLKHQFENPLDLNLSSP